jgi:hypothetical protein
MVLHLLLKDKMKEKQNETAKIKGKEKVNL